MPLANCTPSMYLPETPAAGHCIMTVLYKHRVTVTGPCCTCLTWPPPLAPTCTSAGAIAMRRADCGRDGERPGAVRALQGVHEPLDALDRLGPLLHLQLLRPVQQHTRSLLLPPLAGRAPPRCGCAAKRPGAGVGGARMFVKAVQDALKTAGCVWMGGLGAGRRASGGRGRGREGKCCDRKVARPGGCNGERPAQKANAG